LIINLNRTEKYEKTFPALGTMNVISASGKNSRQAVAAACERVMEIHGRMSVYEKGSDVARINENSGLGAQKIHPDTFSLLKRSLEFSEQSGGAFDITVRPLTQLWGFGKKLNHVPDKDEIQKALPLVNYRDLLLDGKGCTAHLRKAGQSIDLGGIAKGYAADEVRRILQEHGVINALINLGGNIVAMGRREDCTPWRIGVQNPLSDRGEYIGTLEASDQTIVTSGSNEQFFIRDGVRYHHIIDPRTGYPAYSGLMSVTVVCSSSTDADALTTAIFVSGISDSMNLLKSADAQAIFVMQNKDLFLTEALRNTFKRSYS
jgi:FAD:protein FMN transferase